VVEVVVMTMPDPIYIIRETNVHEESDLIAPTTVWACIGNSHRYEETGSKVVGPIPVLFADRMIEGLRRFLEQLGHTVVVENAIDD
jgi:hypothetical protein